MNDMRKTVFIRTAAAPLTLTEFAETQPPALRKMLEDAAEQLATKNSIEGLRANRYQNGDWSIWLEDERGDRHNFVLYISPLELTKTENSRSTLQKPLRFDVLVERECGRPGETCTEYVDAFDYIVKHYSGDVRRQFLRALKRVHKELPPFDRSIEWTEDGVILRSLDESKQVDPSVPALRLVRRR